MTLADRINNHVCYEDEAGTGTIGRIEQIGSPEELYNHPVNKFVASFIGSPAMNFFTITLQDGVLIGDGFKIGLARRSVANTWKKKATMVNHLHWVSVQKTLKLLNWN